MVDSGLLSHQNIEELQTKGHEFILGARIKNESSAIKKKNLSLTLKNGESKIINKDHLKLIITYSGSRAKKDRNNHKRGLAKLEKSIKSGKLTTAHPHLRGYTTARTVHG